MNLTEQGRISQTDAVPPANCSAIVRRGGESGMETAVFIVEGGRALEMVKEHIADRKRVMSEIGEILKELDAGETYSADRATGVLSRVSFKGDAHPEFCKPTGSDRLSHPKKRTAWHKRFKAMKGYRPLPGWIAEEFGIPLTIKYKGPKCNGSSRMGNFFAECGFLYLSVDGPYAMWTPDVPAEVRAKTEKGYEVEEPAKSFRLEFDGCRRIEKEEWEILALQHKLDAKKSA